MRAKTWWTHPYLHPRVTHIGDYGHGYLYEELFFDHHTDLQWVHKLLQSRPGPFLDLGGGSGRLILAEPRERTWVYLDKSRYMLEKAKVFLSHLSPPPLFVQHDITGFKSEMKFSDIVSVRNTLEHLIGTAPRTKAFRAIYRALVSQGNFYFEVHNPQWCARQPYWKKNWWLHSGVRSISHQTATLWQKTSPHHGDQTVLWTHQVQMGGQSIRLSTPLEILTLSQWEELAFETGFEVQSVLAGWENEGSVQNAPKWVFHLRKKAGATLRAEKHHLA